MNRVNTLQERLEQRARQDAAERAQELVAKLPYFPERIRIRRGFLGPEATQDITVWFDNLKQEIRGFYENEFYKQRLDELTQALVAELKVEEK